MRARKAVATQASARECLAARRHEWPSGDLRPVTPVGRSISIIVMGHGVRGVGDNRPIRAGDGDRSKPAINRHR